MEILTDPAAKIFGRDFLDLAAVNKAFATQPDLTIQTPLSPVELALEQARSRGEFPINRVDKSPDGTPLTMCKMLQTLQDRFSEQGWGKILYDTGWYQDEEFFMEDTPRPGLALVSKAPIHGSTGKNYWQQTDLLTQFVGEVYQGREVPNLYQDALKEWAKEKTGLEKVLTSDWRGAARGLAELQINQLLRQKPVEALNDVLVPFMTNGEGRLTNLYTWTNAVASDGDLVDLGGFGPVGANVRRWDPGFGIPDVGVCSSRRYL